MPIIPVHELNARRSEIVQLHSSGRSLSTSDPRQPEDRKLCEGELRCNLLQLNQHCAFLDILIPSIDKIAHDRSYALPPTDDTYSDYRATPEVEDNSEDEGQDDISLLNDDSEGVADDDLVTIGLQVTDMEHFDIERKKRNQNSSKIWHEVRYKRSICGRILCQKKKNTFLTCLLFVS